MQVPAVQLQVAEEEVVIGVVIEHGVAVGIGHKQGEDVAAKVLSLDDVAVVAEEGEETL